MIDYSVKEMADKNNHTRKRFLCIMTACLAIIFAIAALVCRKNGYPFIIDKNIAPDNTKKITVYDKALDDNGFSLKSAVSTIVELGKDGGEWRITYGNCEYKGSWWSPDSKKYVLALEYNGEPHLNLAWLEHNSESNLSEYLRLGVETTELKKYVNKEEEGWPEIEYQFLQWSKDSESMLIYYSFEDKEEKLHEGYFWYNCVEGTVKAVLEL